MRLASENSVRDRPSSTPWPCFRVSAYERSALCSIYVICYRVMHPYPSSKCLSLSFPLPVCKCDLSNYVPDLPSLGESLFELYSPSTALAHKSIELLLLLFFCCVVGANPAQN